MYFIRWFILSVCFMHSLIFWCARPGRGLAQCIVHFINMLCIYASCTAGHINLWGATGMGISTVGPVWSGTRGNSAELMHLCCTAPQHFSVPASAQLPWGYLLQYPSIPHKTGGTPIWGFIWMLQGRYLKWKQSILCHNWCNCTPHILTQVAEKDEGGIPLEVPASPHQLQRYPGLTAQPFFCTVESV